MATLAGPQLEGINVVLRPDTGGKILTEGAQIDSVVVKSHAGYANSEKKIESASLTTSTATGATATVIWTRACPISSVLGADIFVVGKKTGANADGIISKKYQAVSNNAGTCAVVGTTGGSDLENASGTPAVTIVANDTTDSIEVKVAGIAAEEWNWVIHVESFIVTTSA